MQFFHFSSSISSELTNEKRVRKIRIISIKRIAPFFVRQLNETPTDKKRIVLLVQ